MLSVFDKIKNIKEIIIFPYGIDHDFDEDCNDSFDKFFDRFYECLLFLFSIFGIGCVHFFINYEILR